MWKRARLCASYKIRVRIDPQPRRTPRPARRTCCNGAWLFWAPPQLESKQLLKGSTNCEQGGLQKTLSFFSWVGACSGAGRRKLAGRCSSSCSGLRFGTRTAPSKYAGARRGFRSQWRRGLFKGRSESPGRRLHRRPRPLAERLRLSHPSPAELRVCEGQSPPTHTCRTLT